MAAYMTEQQPALYKRILANNPPKLTPENRRWVLGLMGAAVFLRQKETGLAMSIVNRACEIAPDDYGAWEHKLLLLAMAKRHDEFMETFQAAVERFKGQSPTKELQFINAMGRYYGMLRKPLPKPVATRLGELTKKFCAPPRIVLDNIPK